jgi:sporulation protein YlmC with PRC-barrel domain
MKKEILIDIDTNDVNQPIIISMENATGMHYPMNNDIRASVVKAVKNYLSNIKIED